jgi:Fe2+ or Zn2+ uptake regulation protein
MMNIEAHIHIIVTCDDCGKSYEIEEYDAAAIEEAITKNMPYPCRQCLQDMEPIQ